MKQIRLKNSADTYFDKAWELYEEAFPLNERRLYDAQVVLMSDTKYHFDILIEDNQLIGFLLWWDLETFRYIDHFATSKQLRNKGFGKLILEQFINNNSKPILLEVELPDSEINQRRIKFYKRIGFKLNQHHYELPDFEGSQSPLELKLMTYPNLISKKDVDQFVKNCHPIIFDI
ncbi:MAG: GNAT family N-acetyltransferase [Urechidicola sp.]|nr:GNAT family N-acetyltransferase [Urechidicola sp.]